MNWVLTFFVAYIVSLIIAVLAMFKLGLDWKKIITNLSDEEKKVFSNYIKEFSDKGLIYKLLTWSDHSLVYVAKNYRKNLAFLPPSIEKIFVIRIALDIYIAVNLAFYLVSFLAIFYLRIIGEI